MLTAKEIKLKYGISRTSLIEYERKGLIFPKKSPLGHRKYSEESIKLLIDKKDVYPLLISIARKNYGILPITLRLKGGDGGVSNNPNLEEYNEHTFAFYKRVEIQDTGVQWIVNDPELKIVASNQLPRNIYFEEVKTNSVIRDTNHPSNNKIYSFIEDNIINFTEIVDDINQQAEIYFYKKEVFAGQKEFKLIKLTNEIPLFIMGQEVFEPNNSIVPVVYRLNYFY